MDRLKNGSALLCLLLSTLAAAAGALTSCRREPMAAAEAVESLLQARRDKDRAFKSGPESPIPEQDRGAFQGLIYFPIDPALRFRVKLNRYPVPTRIRMATNTGEVRDGLRYGYFEFSVAGRNYRLQVYRLEDSDSPDKPSLFIPFRDATSGKETYGAGRYLDLPENTTGLYDLDFNQAYSPYCAYAEQYSCPVPPEENRLTLPIRAGEKIYSLLRDH